MMFQKYIWRTVLCLFAATTLLSCVDEEKDVPFLSVSLKEVKINHLGFWYGNDDDEIAGNHNTVKANFEVGSNINWTIQSSEEWISLNHTEGERGRYRIFLTIDRNTTGRDREGEITIKAGEHTETIYVDQVYKTGTFSITSPTTINAAKGGAIDESHAYIVIQSNDTWEVEPLDDWLSVDQTSGGSDTDNPQEYRVLVSAEPNTSNYVRTGEIEVRGRGGKATVTVVQDRTGLYADMDMDLTVNKKGEVAPEINPTFIVVAQEAWTLTSNVAWITADVTGGNSGSTTVELTVSQNDSGNERYGAVTLSSTSGLVTVLPVTQTTEVPEDDGHPVGYRYYYEPFDWCIPFGTDDQVMDKNNYSNIGIYGNSSALQAFQDAGLTDYNPGGSCVYIMSDYLKFGKNGNQSGIILPSLPDTYPDKVTNVTLTFDIAPNVSGTNYDKVEFTVEIVEGPGTVNGYSSKTSDSMPHSITDHQIWETMTATLYNVTSETRIAIRSTQQNGTAGQYRWFLDEIECVKHSKVE